MSDLNIENVEIYDTNLNVVNTNDDSMPNITLSTDMVPVNSEKKIIVRRMEDDGKITEMHFDKEEPDFEKLKKELPPLTDEERRVLYAKLDSLGELRNLLVLPQSYTKPRGLRDTSFSNGHDLMTELREHVPLEPPKELKNYVGQKRADKVKERIREKLALKQQKKSH